MAKETVTKHITPIGVAQYPHIMKPDTKFDPYGTYRMRFILPAAEAEKYIQLIDEALEASLEKAKKENKGKRIKQADPPYQLELDPETEEETGNVIFTFKTRAGGERKDGSVWKFILPVFDAKGKRISDKALNVWSGSEVRVSFTIRPWYVASQGAGVKLDMSAVQIVKLVEGGGSANAEDFGFGEEEGFSMDDIEGEFDAVEFEDATGSEDDPYHGDF